MFAFLIVTILTLATESISDDTSAWTSVSVSVASWRPVKKGCEVKMLVFFVILASAAKVSWEDTSAQPQCGRYQEQSDCADDYSAEPQITLCRPGCRCMEGYTRSNLNECVPDLVCGINEVASDCKQVCPPQTCDYDPTKFACKPGPCRHGCNCIDGHLRNDQNVCVPKEECPPIPQECPENEEPTDCAKNIDPNQSTLTIKCRPCQCIENYVRNNDGVCVSKDELCDGDRNITYTLCPNRCTSTCENPNGICTELCREGYGCGCKPGYIYSDGGTCILPQDCPGGYPCKENQTFVYCNAGCPTDTCPENDNQGEIACDPPFPCPSGCACKRNYKWLNDERERCVLASECPPVKCSRENEIHNPCPAPCFSVKCSDPKSTLCTIPLDGTNECKPQCVCMEGYCRNEYGDCVPISHCPPQCGKYEIPTECAESYPETLATEDTGAERISCLPGCKCIDGYTKINGECVPTPCGEFEETNFCIQIYPNNGCPRCRCISGYKRNENGKCVPENTECKGDQNSTFTECPNRCPSTCENPDAICSEKCAPNGCECKRGFVKNDDGKCVLPQDCPGGNPCGRNQTYVACKFGCPTNYCPSYDSSAQVACSIAYPCPGGCACKRNYLIASENDKRCILASECAPFECIGENKKYDSCPPPCFSENCGDEEVGTCNTLLPHECRPRCVCQDGYRRSLSTRECIPIQACEDKPTMLLQYGCYASRHGGGEQVQHNGQAEAYPCPQASGEQHVKRKNLRKGQGSGAANDEEEDYTK